MDYKREHWTPPTSKGHHSWEWVDNNTLDIEKNGKRELRDAERVYVNGILQNGLESGNNKSFWKYVPKTRNFWYLCS